jgi:hypothetical protein
MIRDEDGAVRLMQPLAAVHDHLHAGRRVQRARPRPDALRVDRVRSLRHAQQPSDDDGRSEDQRHDRDRDSSENGSHHREK